MNLIIRYLVLGIFTISICDVSAQNQETPEEEYTRVITGRADKIVDQMEFDDASAKILVRDIIFDHYRFLNEAEESRNADVAKIREEFAENKELRDAKIDVCKAEQELKIRDNHFAFISKLKQIISAQQIDQVKDGLTYGVLPKTYKAFLEMIPSLTEEQKMQILVWLTEAREHAIDGGSSKEKHAWFGKYKGKINNYLSDEGYDLQEERKKWQERIKANK